MRTVIVVWTLGDWSDSQDFYEVFEDMAEAKTAYNKLFTAKNLLTASITGVIESTDYETYEKF